MLCNIVRFLETCYEMVGCKKHSNFENYVAKIVVSTLNILSLNHDFCMSMDSKVVVS